MASTDPIDPALQRLLGEARRMLGFRTGLEWIGIDPRHAEYAAREGWQLVTGWPDVDEEEDEEDEERVLRCHKTAALGGGLRASVDLEYGCDSMNVLYQADGARVDSLKIRFTRGGSGSGKRESVADLYAEWGGTRLCNVDLDGESEVPGIESLLESLFGLDLRDDNVYFP